MIRGLVARLVAARPLGSWLLAAAAAGAIFALSAMPASSLGPQGEFVRFLFNLAHAPLHFGLAFFLATALAAREGGGAVLPWRRALLALGVTMAHALLDEWHQSFVPGRSPDSRDLLTDLGGALAAVSLVALASGARVARPARAGLIGGVALAFLGAAAATGWIGSPR